MRVLFYADPTRHWESFARSADVLADHLVNFLAAPLLKSGRVELKAVVSDIAAWQCRDDARFAGIDLIPFGADDLRRVFPECRSMDAMTRAFFRDELTPEGRAAFGGILLDRLGGWTPEVIVAYPTNFGPLRALFPEALCLIEENGIVSRPPFPRALRFEPVSFLNGFANAHRDELRALVATDGERAELARLREGLRRVLGPVNPLRVEMEELRSRYRRLVLVPVPAANPYGEAAWDDQVLWLRDVLARVPDDVGVIATFHDNVGAQLNARTAAYLQSRHPNLIAKCGGGYGSQSVWMMPYVDAVLNCETMTGFVGLLLGVRMVALDRSYSGWAADAEGLGSLAEALARPPADLSGLLVWLLTRFTVTERRFGDAGWFYRFFADKLAAYRRGERGLGLYAQVEELKDVVDFLLKGTADMVARIGEHEANESRRVHLPVWLEVSRNSVELVLFGRVGLRLWHRRWFAFGRKARG